MSDGEIEYLEEDEELVQKCIENIHHHDETLPSIIPVKVLTEARTVSPSALLIERTYPQDDTADFKRKWHVRDDYDSDYQPNPDEEDSDYDPQEDDRRPKRPKKPKKQPQIQKHIPKPAAVFLPLPDKGKATAKKVKIGSSTLKLSSDVTIKPLKKKRRVPFACKIPIRTADYLERAKTLRNNMLEILNRQKSVATKPVAKNGPSAKQILQNLAKKMPQKKTEIALADVVIKKVAKPNPLIKMHNVLLRDYEDPKYFQDIKDPEDEIAVKRWNEECKRQLMKIGSESADSPKNTQYLQKVRAKIDGKMKNVIQLHYNDKEKSIQALLPRFESTNSLEVHFQSGTVTKNSEDCKNTTILTKEVTKDGETLVAYNAKDFQATTYELVKNDDNEDDSAKMQTRMLMSCRVCAKCYQYSWRGSKGSKDVKDIKCALCASGFTSAYNLLSHVKCHQLSVDDKRKQNRMLAKIMRYHYVCRICRFKADSIPDLRKHLRLHRGTEKFYCDVGQHVTT